MKWMVTLEGSIPVKLCSSESQSLMLCDAAAWASIQRVPAPLASENGGKKRERQVKNPRDFPPAYDAGTNILTTQSPNITPVHSGQEYVVQTRHLQPKKEKTFEQDKAEGQGLFLLP